MNCNSGARHFYPWAKALGLAALLLVGACDDDPTRPVDDDGVAVEADALRLLHVMPRPGSMVSADDVIVARLVYDLPDSVWGVPKSDLEFTAVIVFKATEERHWISVGEQSKVDLVRDSGLVRFTYPLAVIWNFCRLEHPPTVLFFLVAWTEEGAGMVVARTEELHYREWGLRPGSEANPACRPPAAQTGEMAEALPTVNPSGTLRLQDRSPVLLQRSAGSTALPDREALDWLIVVAGPSSP